MSMDPAQRREILVRYLQGHFARVGVNLGRVKTLCDLAPGHNSHQSADLYRAAVVLLYATLEDFLRYVAGHRLKGCGPEVLDSIPILGSKDPQRAEKFLLGQLAQHRGLTVDEVIGKSVDAYVERMTFSDTSDIARLFKAIGVRTEPFDTQFSELQPLLKRRHDIVHRADMGAIVVNGERLPNPLTAAEVDAWNTSVLNFLSLAMGYCMPASLAEDSSGSGAALREALDSLVSPY